MKVYRDQNIGTYSRKIIQSWFWRYQELESISSWKLVSRS